MAFLTPYSRIDLNKMAVAFDRSVAQLEDELLPLILDGKIQVLKFFSNSK